MLVARMRPRRLSLLATTGLVTVFLLLAGAWGLVSSAHAAAVSVSGLATDGAAADGSTGAVPLGIDDSTPRLTWKLQDSDRGVMQTRYEVLVATTAARAVPGQADVWDSGVQQSSNLYATYGGPALSSDTRYYWSVGVSVNGAQPSSWSAPTWFETAFLFPAGVTGFNALGVGQPASNCTTTTCYQCQSAQICGAPGWQGTGAQWIQGPARPIPPPPGTTSSAAASADDSCCLQPNTVLAAAAGPGATTLYVNSIAAFAAGQTVTLDTGANQETPSVTAVGTAPASNTTLAAPANVGDTTISVASVSGYTVGAPISIDTAPNQEGSTITAVGTAAGAATTLFSAANANDTNVKVSSVSGIVAGQQIGIDSGANFEKATVQTVGTAGVSTTLFAAAAANATNIKVASTSGLAAGNVLNIDTGAGAENATIQTVGTQGRNTTLSVASIAGATGIRVASTTGLTAGDTLTIDTAGNVETDTIASIPSPAPASPSPNVLLNSALTLPHASGGQQGHRRRHGHHAHRRPGQPPRCGRAGQVQRHRHHARRRIDAGARRRGAGTRPWLRHRVLHCADEGARLGRHGLEPRHRPDHLARTHAVACSGRDRRRSAATGLLPQPDRRQPRRQLPGDPPRADVP